MNDNEIPEEFKEVVNKLRLELRPSLRSFLEPYTQDADSFIDQCYESPSPAPARMLHSLHRLIAFADESTGDSLKVFWICVCAESLYKLAELPQSGSKKRVEVFFDTFILDTDRSVFEQSIQRSLGDAEIVDEFGSIREAMVNLSLTTSEIAELLYKARSELVHGYGDYDIHLSREGDRSFPMLNLLNVGQGSRVVVRTFEISLSYQMLRSIFIRAGLNCIVDYLERSVKGNAD